MWLKYDQSARLAYLHLSHQEMIVGFLQQLIIRIPKAAPAVSGLFVRDEPQVLSTIKQKNKKYLY